jgi:hypothetical protein
MVRRMKWQILPAGVLVVLAGLTFAQAQTASPGAAAGESVEEVIRTFEEQEAALEKEIEPQLSSAKAKLISEARAIIDKFNQSRKPDDALAVQNELDRFEKHGIAPTERSPVPVLRTPALTYGRAVQAADKTIALNLHEAEAGWPLARSAGLLHQRLDRKIGRRCSGAERQREARHRRDRHDHRRGGISWPHPPEVA